MCNDPYPDFVLRQLYFCDVASGRPKIQESRFLLACVAFGTLLMIIITVLHVTHTGSR